MTRTKANQAFDPKRHTGGGYHILARMLELKEPFLPYAMNDEEIPESDVLDYRYRIKLARFTKDSETSLKQSFTCVTVVDLLTDLEHHRALNTNQFDNPLLLKGIAIATHQNSSGQWSMTTEVNALLQAIYDIYGLALPAELLVGFSGQTHNGYIEIHKAGSTLPGCYLVDLPIVADAGYYGVYVNKVQLIIEPAGFYDGGYNPEQAFYQVNI